MFEQELFPDVLYAFKHPLTHEVAYRSQLGERRARLHAAAARAIAEHYPDRLDERSALLAGHWEAAGEALEAARWHARAAAWSGTSDPNQSLRHWRKVRELADSLPDSAESAMLGLTARIFWLQFSWRLGISREEAEGVYLEAERMASKAGDLRSRALLFTIYGGIRGVNDGEPREHARLGKEAVALAEEVGDPALYLVTAISSYAMFVIGEAREGIAMLDRAIELADDDPTLAAGIAVGCPLAYCLTFKGGLISTLGKVAEARALLERGMDMAREHGDLEVVGWGHMWNTWIAWFTGDAQCAYAHAQGTLEIAERIGDAFSRTYAWYWLGLAEVMRGEWARAKEAIERSIDLAREHRTAIEGEAYRLAMLARPTPASASWMRHGSSRARASRRGAREVRWGARCSRSSRWPERPLPQHEQPAHAELARELGRALELSQRLEIVAFEPLIRVELAELARRRGDAGDPRARAACGAPDLRRLRPERQRRAARRRAGAASIVGPGSAQQGSHRVSQLKPGRPLRRGRGARPFPKRAEQPAQSLAPAPPLGQRAAATRALRVYRRRAAPPPQRGSHVMAPAGPQAASVGHHHSPPHGDRGLSLHVVESGAAPAFQSRSPRAPAAGEVVVDRGVAALARQQVVEQRDLVGQVPPSGGREVSVERAEAAEKLCADEAVLLPGPGEVGMGADQPEVGDPEIGATEPDRSAVRCHGPPDPVRGTLVLSRLGTLVATEQHRDQEVVLGEQRHADG